jgi:3-methyladenine DNA glycosylase/8-oxoguanine DNA glycosylase
VTADTDDGGTRLRLAARPPFRLGAVVRSHGWFQTAPFGWDEEGDVLSRTERLTGGSCRVTVRAASAGVSVACDRALDERDRAELRVRMRRMLQLDVDVADFLAAVAFDPALAEDLERHGAGRLLAGTTLYEDVVKTICGTNTTWRQAVACIGRIAAWAADGAFPTPETLLRKGEDGLRGEGRIGYRAPYVVAAARSALDGTLAEIEAEAPGLDGRALVRRLGGIRGVGPASAGFLGLLLGRFDVLVIDSATLRIASRIWFDGRVPTRQEIEARVAPAGPWRGLALYWAMVRAWQRETGLETA